MQKNERQLVSILLEFTQNSRTTRRSRFQEYDAMNV